MKFQDSQKTFSPKPQNSVMTNLIIYFIFIMTMLLVSPLIFMTVVKFSSNSEKIEANKGNPDEAVVVKAKKYSFNERSLDLSPVKSMNYSLLTANVTNNSEGILFCSEASEDENIGEIMRIVKFTADGEAVIYKYFFPQALVQKIREKEYVYKDYSDGFIYFAYTRDAHLFDIEKMRISATYFFPQEYEVYHAALSNDKTMMALATDKGLFVRDVKMTYMKELISAVEAVGGVKTLPKKPVWSGTDEYIYYTLYADNYVKSAGRTPLSLGRNEQFNSLENTDFYVLNNDFIFYYYSTSYQTGFENMFRCGYYNANERKMTDMIRSQIYYFDTKISSEGTHLAALSYNGKMKKISVIDVKTKKNIYSALYDEIYDFAFSPNEKNIIIYGMKNGKEDLRIIEMDWTEE